MTQRHSDVTTLAHHLVIQRSDGAGIATTGHDRPLLISGVEHGADSDIAPKQLVVDDRIMGSYLTIEGGLSHILTHEDLVSARWEGAAVELSFGDWQDPQEPLLIAKGLLNEVRDSSGDINGLVDLTLPRLRASPCQQVSPECRAQLGDERCGVSMRTRTLRTRTVGTAGTRIECEVPLDDRFRSGRVRWLSGQNCGLSQTVLHVEDGVAIMRESPPLPVLPGDALIIWQGCDGRRSTCHERFNNVANFRGEPDLPGTDSLIRYPGD